MHAVTLCQNLHQFQVVDHARNMASAKAFSRTGSPNDQLKGEKIHFYNSSVAIYRCRSLCWQSSAS